MGRLNPVQVPSISHRAVSDFFPDRRLLECPVLAAKGERVRVALRAGETRGAVPGSSGQLRAAPGSSGAPRRSINQNASMNMQIFHSVASLLIRLVGYAVWLLALRRSTGVRSPLGGGFRKDTAEWLCASIRLIYDDVVWLNG